MVNRKIRRLPIEHDETAPSVKQRPCPSCGKEMELVGVDEETYCCRHLDGCINADWWRLRPDGQLEIVRLPF